MKLLLVLCLVAAASAKWYDEIDWTKVKTRDIVLNQTTGTISGAGRIAGGEAATQNQFPYQAGVLIFTLEQTYFCGGALITTNYVLTAAHCIEQSVEIQVRLGAQNVMSQEISQQRFTTSTWYLHPGYNAETISHDLGLVELPFPATINAAVQTIPLPTWSQTDYTFAGSNARVLGWGAESDGSTTVSSTLRYVDSTIMTNLACNIGYLGQILGSHICTSGEGGIGACTGDSGGCVVSEGRLVGIISFALSFSCQAGWPSGHARVTSGLDWIYLVTNAQIDP